VRAEPIVLGIDVLLPARALLRQIEDVGVGIVCAVGAKGRMGGRLHGAQRRIELAIRANSVIDIVDFDAEMIQAAGGARRGAELVHAYIAVAQHDRERAGRGLLDGFMPKRDS